MNDQKVRVRFAPSPTGPLHLGGVRTALYNYLFAKRYGGDFLLRVEDTDQTRYVEGAEEYVIESLKWCGLIPDEGPGFGGEYGPYRQSERKEMYREYAEKLVDEGKAYYAFDTAEELEAMRERLKEAKSSNLQYSPATRGDMRNAFTMDAEEVKRLIAAGEPYVIRFKMPENIEVKVVDLIRGNVIVNSDTLDDKVLFKSDGMPTYHLANIVDDHTMKITHVIRGEEWLPSAPLHVLLYEAFGWQPPQFAHLPLILKPDGNGKLSKRDGDRLGFPVFPLEWKDPLTGEVSMGYREQGYFRQAFINMLALLGWNPGTEQEIFSMPELIEAFHLSRVGKGGARFDPEKTKWFNEQYLRSTANGELAKMIKPLVEAQGFKKPDHFLEGVCELMKERVSFVNDIFNEAVYFFEMPQEYDEKTLRKRWKENTSDIMKRLMADFKDLSHFEPAAIEEVFKTFLEREKLGMGAVLPNLRLLITGVGMGPGLFEIMALLGKEESIFRMKKGIEKLS